MDSRARTGWLVTGCLVVVGAALIAAATTDNYWIGGGPGLGAFEILVALAGIVLIASSFAPLRVKAPLLGGVMASIAAVMISEVLLRLFFAPVLGPIHVLSDGYLYALNPNTTRQHTELPVNGGRTFRYRINSQGHRGPELGQAQVGRRVLVYGDSFVQADYTPSGETFTEVLGAKLTEARGAPVEVINAGVAGYGPDQTYRRMEEDLSELSPDLVLVVIYAGNDFGDLVRNKLFRLVDDEQLLENPFMLHPEIRRSALLSHRELYTRKLLRRISFLANSGTSPVGPEQRIQSALKQQLGEYQNYVLAGDNVVRELRSDPYSADIALLPDSESARYKVRLMGAVLQAIKETLEARDLEYLVVGVPHPIDVMNGTHSAGAIDRQAFPGYDPDRLMNTLQSLCVDNQIPYIDLMPVMRSGGERFFLAGGDDHWNSEGQRAGAHAVAEALAAVGVGPE